MHLHLRGLGLMAQVHLWVESLAFMELGMGQSLSTCSMPLLLYSSTMTPTAAKTDKGVLKEIRAVERIDMCVSATIDVNSISWTAKSTKGFIIDHVLQSS